MKYHSDKKLEDFSVEEQERLRDLLPLCAQRGSRKKPTRPDKPFIRGDFSPPAFACTMSPDKKRVKGGEDMDSLDIPWFLKGEPRPDPRKSGKGFMGWLKALFGSRCLRQNKRDKMKAYRRSTG